ncbi:MAG: hypothetical protein GWN58_02605 [Anaerolineae bacterium]|nr:hypothetical protein [Anaerolineae bacterium]
MWYAHRLTVNESTVRRLTHRHGKAAEALAREEVTILMREMTEAPANPEQLLVSVDGAFVQLTSGEWREIKSLAVGEFKTKWEQAGWQEQVKTEALSYFSRSYAAEAFGYYAWAELHRRGLEKARTVVAVNDGAEWIQHFLDYHCPQAERVIDFAHAASYVAQAGKAIWEEESETFKGWFAAACHRLKHRPPEETVANLRLLQPKAKTDEQAAQIDGALYYLNKRLPMLDYAHFRRQGYPIGSGSVESGHKVVVQRRMKGAGMRWAEHHLDAMLALRNLLCNDRWEEGWQQVVLFQQEQLTIRRIESAEAKQPPPPSPITFAALEAAGLLPEEEITEEPAPPKSKRPGPDHPWRNGKWPTNEAWKWN